MRSPVLLLAVVVVAGCARSRGDTVAAAPQSPATGGAPAVASVARTIYVDVRTPQEYAAAHVAGAINIPHDQMEQRWPELQRYAGQPLVLYCRSGHRAGLALDVLKQHGLANAVNGGGLDSLKAKGAPIQDSTAAGAIR